MQTFSRVCSLEERQMGVRVKLIIEYDSMYNPHLHSTVLKEDRLLNLLRVALKDNSMDEMTLQDHDTGHRSNKVVWLIR